MISGLDRILHQNERTRRLWKADHCMADGQQIDNSEAQYIIQSAVTDCWTHICTEDGTNEEVFSFEHIKKGVVE